MKTFFTHSMVYQLIRKVVLVLTAVFILQNFYGQQIKKEITLGNFKALRTIGKMTVYIEQGSENKLAFELSGIEEKNLQISNEKNTLTIKIANVINQSNIQVMITITCKSLSEIGCFSGASVSYSNVITQGNFTIISESGGEFTADLNVDTLNASCSSGGTMVIKGTCRYLDAKASTGSTLSAYELVSNKVEAKASNGGKIKISVISELDASSTLGGVIIYKGNPTILQKDISLKGTIEPYL
jgi:hypothetical protein